MKYTLTKSKDSGTNIFMVILGLILLFLIFRYLLMPCLDKNKKVTETYGSFYELPYASHLNTDEYYPKDSGLLFANSKCCKSCCKNLWPVPFDVDDCPTCENGKEKYVASNYMCQGENGSGCVCVTEEKANYLDRRGNNRLMGPRVIFPFDNSEKGPSKEHPMEIRKNESMNERPLPGPYNERDVPEVPMPGNCGSDDKLNNEVEGVAEPNEHFSKIDW